MRNQAQFELFYSDCNKQLVISEVNGEFEIWGDELTAQKSTLKESLDSDTELTIGACESSSFEFQTTNVTSTLVGKTINVDFILDDDTENPFRVGTYKIDRATFSADKKKRDVIAYDLMYDIINADVTEWYESFNFTNINLRQFRNAFFTHLGIDHELVDLVNDNLRIYKTIKNSTVSGKDVITAICEINGVFGHINSQNEFVYINLDSTKVGDIQPAIYKSLEYQDYKVRRIDSVQIRQETNDVGVVVDSGTRDNTLIVQNNFLVFGLEQADLETVATNLLNQVYVYREFIPYSLNAIGNLCYELGDVIEIEDASGNKCETVILNRTLTGISALWDNYYADGTEYREERVNGVESEYERLRGRYMLLDKSIDGINVTIGDDEKGLIHDVKANTEGITAEISKREELGNRVTNVELSAGNLELRMESFEKQLDGEYESYNVTEEPDINALGKDKPNYPSENWCTNVFVREDDALKFDDYPDGRIPFIYTEDDYKRNIRAVAFDMDTLNSYRFRLKEGQYNWEVIPDTEMKVLLEKIVDIQISTDGLATQVERNTKDLETKETIESVNSKLEQSAEGILQEVSGKYYDKNQIDNKGYVTKGTKNYTTIDGILNEVSETYVANNSVYKAMVTTVEQTSQSIVGKAEKRGGEKGYQSFQYELESDHFSLSANGRDVFTCTKDGLSIVGNCDIKGRIIATSGYIGSETSGFVISDKAIYSAKSKFDSNVSGVYIGTNGISIGGVVGSRDSTFSVDTSGELRVDDGVLARYFFIDSADECISCHQKNTWDSPNVWRLYRGGLEVGDGTGSLEHTVISRSGGVSTTAFALGGYSADWLSEGVIGGLSTRAIYITPSGTVSFSGGTGYVFAGYLVTSVTPKTLNVLGR